MLSQKFCDQVADLEINEDVFRREMANKHPAVRSYIIMFTPRSGSSWLTSILSGTKLLGVPEEYVNEGFVRDIAQATNSRDPKGMLAILRRRRKTANGIFGIEATSTHIQLFGEAEFFESFDPGTLVFHLWRDNIVAQGISLYRAVSTKRFHSSDPPAAAPAYDAAGIRSWIEHLCLIENENIRMLDRGGYVPQVLRYEDIIRSRSATIRIFADALRVSVAASVDEGAGELRKLRDEWNQTTELRFRDEQKDFVRDLDSLRLIKRG